MDSVQYPPLKYRRHGKPLAPPLQRLDCLSAQTICYQNPSSISPTEEYYRPLSSGGRSYSSSSASPFRHLHTPEPPSSPPPDPWVVSSPRLAGETEYSNGREGFHFRRQSSGSMATFEQDFTPLHRQPSGKHYNVAFRRMPSMDDDHPFSSDVESSVYSEDLNHHRSHMFPPEPPSSRRRLSHGSSGVPRFPGGVHVLNDSVEPTTSFPRPYVRHNGDVDVATALLSLRNDTRLRPPPARSNQASSSRLPPPLSKAHTHPASTLPKSMESYDPRATPTARYKNFYPERHLERPNSFQGATTAGTFLPRPKDPFAARAEVGTRACQRGDSYTPIDGRVRNFLAKSHDESAQLRSANMQIPSSVDHWRREVDDLSIQSSDTTIRGLSLARTTQIGESPELAEARSERSGTTHAPHQSHKRPQSESTGTTLHSNTSPDPAHGTSFLFLTPSSSTDSYSSQSLPASPGPASPPDCSSTSAPAVRSVSPKELHGLAIRMPSPEQSRDDVETVVKKSPSLEIITLPPEPIPERKELTPLAIDIPSLREPEEELSPLSPLPPSSPPVQFGVPKLLTTFSPDSSGDREPSPEWAPELVTPVELEPDAILPPMKQGEDKTGSNSADTSASGPDSLFDGSMHSSGAVDMSMSMDICAAPSAELVPTVQVEAPRSMLTGLKTSSPLFLSSPNCPEVATVPVQRPMIERREETRRPETSRSPKASMSTLPVKVPAEPCSSKVILAGHDKDKTKEIGSSRPRPPLVESNQVSSKGKEKASSVTAPIHSRLSQENVEQVTSKKRVHKHSVQARAQPARPSSPALSDSSLSSVPPPPRKKRARKRRIISTEEAMENPPQSAPSAPPPTQPPQNAQLAPPSNPNADHSEAENGREEDFEKQLVIDEAGKEELRGFVIQTLAMSRLSSMPASCILKEVQKDAPQLAAQRSWKAWLKLVKRTLRGSKVFGRIDRDGLDADDKPLECMWFYIPERDDDRDRAALLKEMMPKKRSETRKHKQYYYRPIGKFSRWDTEDEGI